ncbi:MAG: hypothetical protein ABIN67_04270 [Ferruginibacter sp.]
MKYFIIILSVFASIFISCGHENKPDPQPKKIVIKTPSPTIIIKDPPENTTTITLEKKAIKVQTHKTGEGDKDSVQH